MLQRGWRALIPTCCLVVDGPRRFPKAMVQFESDEEYYLIIVYLTKLGIFDFIACDDIFEVDGKRALNGLPAVINNRVWSLRE